MPSIETVFQISNLLVLPFWALMIFAPGWSWTRRLLASPWAITPPAILYLILIVPQLGGLMGSLLNPSAAGIAQALSAPEAATIAWAHFLAFDLFVGRWAYLDSRERGLSAWIMGLVLFSILMVGPIGFLVYLGVRAIARRP